MNDLSYISVRRLVKKYGETVALDDISFAIRKGELFGFIGPDGAGKTTLFRIITSLMTPGSGTVTIDGLDVVKDYRKIRNRIGYMPGKFSLYQDLSVRENLEFFATVFGTTVEQNYDLIRGIYAYLEPFESRLAGRLSGGMKQKLALSCALIHRPDLLVLDEPTTGVDAVSRKEFWEMLADLKKKGITIVVSTPYMDEAILCDRVALIQRGRIMSIDTPSGIINNYPGKLLSVKAENIYRLLVDLRKWEGTRSVWAFGQVVHVSPQNENMDPGDLNTWLELQGHSGIVIQKIEPGIEDCFMDLMVSKQTEVL